MTDVERALFTVSSGTFPRASHGGPTVPAMHDEPSTPAARIAARSRRLRAAAVAGALALLATFSGLAAGRMADDGASAAATTVTAIPAVSAAAPSAVPDAVSGAS